MSFIEELGVKKRLVDFKNTITRVVLAFGYNCRRKVMLDIRIDCEL